MTKYKTAPQILEHYSPYVLEARIKSDIAYEKGYKTAINQMK